MHDLSHQHVFRHQRRVSMHAMPCEYKLPGRHQQRVFMRVLARPRRLSRVCMRGVRGRHLQTKLFILRTVPFQHVLD